MGISNTVNILIAEDNEISRELMSTILKTQGYNITPAIDGTQAIEAVKNHAIDLALVDLNMEPTGGFEFVKYLVLNSIDLPVLIITADDSSDILTRASDLGVTRVLQKPVEPDRLIGTVKNILKRYGHNFAAIPAQSYSSQYTHDQLIQRAIELAERNAKTKKGGPFGAVISNEKGEVLGEGVNGITSRADPTAHAEIMAIRQASEKLGSADLSSCTLYCSSEPTAIGKALIVSVGIKAVYFGLRHSDIEQECAREKKITHQPDYQQINRDDALKMFQRWQDMSEKLND